MAQSCSNGFISPRSDPGPRQSDAPSGTMPSNHQDITWQRPARNESSRAVYVRGGHEGTDYVDKRKVKDVPIFAAADGEIVYMRKGCPQSTSNPTQGVFPRNSKQRECGAGWGDHVVIRHANGIYTRYAHLRPNTIRVQNGQQVRRGEIIALMGNTGRSELRHLHFELGTKNNAFIPCNGNQNFSKIYDVERLSYGAIATPDKDNGKAIGRVCTLTGSPQGSQIFLRRFTLNTVGGDFQLGTQLSVPERLDSGTRVFIRGVLKTQNGTPFFSVDSEDGNATSDGRIRKDHGPVFAKTNQVNNVTQDCK